MVEHLPSKCDAFGSNPRTTKKISNNNTNNLEHIIPMVSILMSITLNIMIYDFCCNPSV
jgi:hypothetical protein